MSFASWCRFEVSNLSSIGWSFKSVTATAVMQLAERGELKLSDTINRYLGDDQAQDRLQSEKPVNFTDSLSHWSGLTSGAEIEPIWGRKLPLTLEQRPSKPYSIRPPETKWEHNNDG